MWNMKIDSIRTLYPHVLDRKFLRPITPQLKLNELVLKVFIGSERDEITTLTTGDLSILLLYKDCPVSVISYVMQYEADLNIVQLQGAKSRKSYRGHNGVEIAPAFAKETDIAATALGVDRVTMPDPRNIKGIVDVKADAIMRVIQRYEMLTNILLLRWSQDEQLFVKDVK